MSLEDPFRVFLFIGKKTKCIHSFNVCSKLLADLNKGLSTFSVYLTNMFTNHSTEAVSLQLPGEILHMDLSTQKHTS